MFLLSRETMEKHGYLRNQISISPFKASNLIRTFYYFRAGDSLKIISPKEDLIDLEAVGKTRLPANGFGLIKSREHFTFDTSIMGMFGNLSDLVKKGLQIIYSPSIDPGFEGHLTLGIKNNTEFEVELLYEENIGKILFFNVADTVIPMSMLVEEPQIREKLIRRKEGQEF